MREEGISAHGTLVNALADRREAIGLSIPKFARLIGVSERAVRSLDSGERVPGVKVLGAIVVAFEDLEPAVMDYLRERGAEVLGDFSTGHWYRTFHRSKSSRAAGRKKGGVQR